MLLQLRRFLDVFGKQLHQVVIGPDVGHFKVVHAILEPREGLAHLPDQVENLQVRCLVLGMVAGILLMREIVSGQKPADLPYAPF